MALKTTVTTLAADSASEHLSLLVVGDGVLATEALPRVGAVMVGRAADCDVRIDDGSISRNHAVLHLGEALYIVDKASANGTWVRDLRIAPEQPTEIRLNEAVRLGTVTVIVQKRAPRVQPPRIRSHAYFEDRLEDECNRAAALGGSFVVVHVVGDDVRALHEATAGSLRDIDVAASYAPDELELLLIDALPEHGQRVVHAIDAACAARGLAARVGSAWYPRDGRDPSALAARARNRAVTLVPTAIEANDIVVVDERMGQLHRLVARVAAADISVLLQGETGVGKEVIAELIHRQSTRALKPFVRLNCAALTETLLESELFGHEKGAFTGAVATKPGLLEVAEGGVVFLDEVGELLPSTQAKLLRVLDERKLIRVGGLTPRSIDVRLVSATNRDLEAEVARGAFRMDLLYRLNAMSIIIPPLRERAGEIVPLAWKFLHGMSAKLGRTVPRLTEDAIGLLRGYSWPGNVRELKNVIERALVLCTGDVIDVRDLPDKMRLAAVPVAPAPQAARDAETDEETEERQAIVAALEACAGNQTHAARLLGISRRTLINKLEKFAMPRPRKR